MGPAALDRVVSAGPEAVEKPSSKEAGAEGLFAQIFQMLAKPKPKGMALPAGETLFSERLSTGKPPAGEIAEGDPSGESGTSAGFLEGLEGALVPQTIPAAKAVPGAVEKPSSEEAEAAGLSAGLFPIFAQPKSPEPGVLAEATWSPEKLLTGKMPAGEVAEGDSSGKSAGFLEGVEGARMPQAIPSASAAPAKSAGLSNGETPAPKIGDAEPPALTMKDARGSKDLAPEVAPVAVALRSQPADSSAPPIRGNVMSEKPAEGVPAGTIPPKSEPSAASADPQSTRLDSSGGNPPRAESPQTAESVCAVPVKPAEKQISPQGKELPAQQIVKADRPGGGTLSPQGTVESGAMTAKEGLKAAPAPGVSPEEMAGKPGEREEARLTGVEPVPDRSAAAQSAVQTAAVRRKARKDDPFQLHKAQEQVVEASGGTREVRGGAQPAAVSSGLPSPSVEARVSTLQDLVESLDRRILSMVHKGEQTMRLTLQPGNLGRLTLLCREDGAALQIEIQASNSTVQSLLQRQEGAVRELLQSHGSTVGQFDVTTGGGQHGPSQQQQGAGENDPARGSWFESGIGTASPEEDEEVPVAPAERIGTVSILA